MPPLDTIDNEAENTTIAVLAEVLYLSNLLLVPGVAFVVLFFLYKKHVHSTNDVNACHLKQTLEASIWAGILIVVVTAGILILSGFDHPWGWVILIIYFTTIHATLVLLGVVGLSRALAAKHFHYPFIGVRCDRELKS